MILVFGSINVDLVARVEAIPRPGETVLAPGYETLFGGKGANQAVAAARVAEPGRVAMVGRVGDDAFGALCRENLAHRGVGLDGVVLGPEPTGCAFITVDATGENAITVGSGANAAVTVSDLPAGLVTGGTTLVLQMEVPFDASLAAARRAKQAGGRVVWNLAPVPAYVTAEETRALVAATTVLVVNEHEARAAARRLRGPEDPFNQNPVEEDPFEAAAFLAEAGATTCIVTAGARGAFAIRVGEARVAVPATPITPVDTTGAGDTFVGILAAGLDEGRPLEDAMRRACRGAALACLAPGAQPGMPDRAALDAAS